MHQALAQEVLQHEQALRGVGGRGVGEGEAVRMEGGAGR